MNAFRLPRVSRRCGIWPANTDRPSHVAPVERASDAPTIPPPPRLPRLTLEQARQLAAVKRAEARIKDAIGALSVVDHGDAEPVRNALALDLLNLQHVEADICASVGRADQ